MKRVRFGVRVIGLELGVGLGLGLGLKLGIGLVALFINVQHSLLSTQHNL